MKIQTTKVERRSIILFFSLFMIAFVPFIHAQEEMPQAPEVSEAPEPDEIAEQNDHIRVIKFKDADIRIVLQSIAEKAYREGKKVNIVTSPDVEGAVSVNLERVDWLTALEAILKTYGYDYEWIGENIILVDTLEKLAEKRDKEAQAAQQEPLATITYHLKYLDARDVRKVIEGQLTPRGKITVLEFEPQKGWKARGGYGGEFKKTERIMGAKPRTRTLIITDTQSNVEILLEAIKTIDVMPRQVLIEARIMEVNHDFLEDIGVDFGTGTDVGDGNFTNQGLDGGKTDLGGINLGSQNKPSIFSPKVSDLSGIWPFDSGLSLSYRKLTGSEYEILLHALSEDVYSNTLSAPRIVTLDGQEAYIMVGERRPIVESTIESAENSVGIASGLKEYQPLGIELNVIPRIAGGDQINMTIYPSVTSSSQNVTATSSIEGETITNDYPIILVREVQTQILINDGETIVIGGLLKDVKSDGVFKTPILGDIPLIGWFFQRKTEDKEKIDLIIFITAKIVNPGDIASQEVANIERVTTEFEEHEQE